ncbi:MAG TPA: peptidylprolyl isomerase [Pyrinomonadaceae bacterium]|jgi:cyclophilin family peptidyl-prolyl cis-trans isomerase/HEAT repeat protein
MKMKILFALFFALAFCFNAAAQNAQIGQSILIRIVRAEDERRFDQDLQNLMKAPDAKIRSRAALAAGRIGDERAIESLTALLEKDQNQDVRQTAAFALGEIESAKAAAAILRILQNPREPNAVRACAVEAAGKIGAANQKDAQAKDLSEAILGALDAENAKQNPNREIILLGLTAALRTRGKDADLVVAKFLTGKDERVRADALNTLARLRAKNESTNAKIRALLSSDDSPIVRANAARALGAAEDKNALNLLIEAAATDDDLRVRVSAIRSLAALKDKTATAPLLARGEKLLADYKKAKTKFSTPAEKNELLEIATSLGRLLQNSNDERAIKFLNEFRDSDKYQSIEAEIGFARVSPSNYSKTFTKIQFPKSNASTVEQYFFYSSLFQGIGEFGNFTDTATRDLREKAIGSMREGIEAIDKEIRLNNKGKILAIPDIIRAFAQFKTNDLSEILRVQLKRKDVIIRVTAAELLSEQPSSNENIEALKTAFIQSLITDKHENDAQLAILSALVKLNKNQAVNSLKAALDAPDYLIRRIAAQLIKQNDLTKEFPNLDAKVGTVKPQNPASGTKLGQVLNTEADYRRAVSRKNGQAKAIVTTEKGVFAIEFFPEDAPLAVDNFIKLAKSNYFNNVAIHRVVPNFVVQDGDPRGDGNGSPGWQIRCEINKIPYERGAVGMALSGKDTGGSQWFVTHSPQPHLDGGYTVFGRVNETDMKIVDNLARGDKIINVKIVEGNVSRKGKQTQKKAK